MRVYKQLIGGSLLCLLLARSQHIINYGQPNAYRVRMELLPQL